MDKTAMNLPLERISPTMAAAGAEARLARNTLTAAASWALQAPRSTTVVPPRAQKSATQEKPIHSTSRPVHRKSLFIVGSEPNSCLTPTSIGVRAVREQLSLGVRGTGMCAGGRGMAGACACALRAHAHARVSA